jgi:peptidoglycan-N-acetylglucosamine deacetylase
MVVVAAVLFAAFALAHTAPFPFLLEAFRPSKSIWHVPQQPGAQPALYLTFDDGPNPDWTPALLDALAESGVRATFFLIDEHITPETAGIVKRIAADGHAIGLHTGSRKPVVMSPQEFVQRLDAAAGRIRAISGMEPCRLFRPHAGWRSATMYKGLDRAGYTLAGWSWGMWDWDWWRDREAGPLADKLARKAAPGDVIVIHDGHHVDPRADRRYAAETVRLLVPRLRAKGFTFGTLCAPAATS